MAYAIALQMPESPVKEEWTWITDQQLSYNGSEDLIPLAAYPKRIISGQYTFDRVQDVRRHQAFAFTRFDGYFSLPLYYHQVKLKAPVASGAFAVLVNATRSDFREGRGALIVEGDNFELLTVESVDESSLTFTTALVGDYSARALICPVTEAYSDPSASFSRVNTDDGATASFRYNEHEPWAPFLSPLNEVALTMFDGKVVLEPPAMGTDFGTTVDTGIVVTNYLGLPDILSAWKQSQLAFTLTWLVNRVFDLDSWLWWFPFADHVQGSAIPFLIPTHREDLSVISPAVGGGNSLIVAGNEYSEHYAGLDTFKRIVIASDAGRHYALVSVVETLDGDNRLTFSPPLPAGAGWAINQRVEFLLKVRIADDKVTCDHYGLQSQVTLALRTVS